MRARGKVKKLSINQKRYKEVVKTRVQAKTPPVQYTHRLKTRKQKKLKVIGSADIHKLGRSDNAPKDDSQFIPASFKEVFLHRKQHIHLRPGIGDTKGMTKKDTKNKLPKQGRNESDIHYLERVNREVEDEVAKIEFAKQQKTQLIPEGKIKSKKKKKSLRRLSEKKRIKSLHADDKRKTGFEHLQDVVKFNEVVTAPPINLPIPRKIGGSAHRGIHAVDRFLST